MKTQTLVIDTNTNVGTVDRYIRFAIGASLISVPLFYQGVDAEYAALTSLVAIPVLFTAIARWCPLYAFLHVQSIKHRYDNNRFYGKNISTADTLVRYLLGTALIMATMMLTSVADPWLVVLALMAIPIISSAIMQWDPVYAMFEIGTHQPQVTTSYVGDNIVTLFGQNRSDVEPNRPSGGSARAA
ncbi:YgaP family membrane protein [Kaarinaea lacus]